MQRVIMSEKKPKPQNRFRYKIPDPVTGGTWHISSGRELTAEEIERGLRSIAFWGEDRPKADEISTFKWPEV
jgi:hypothetical protein